MLKVYSAFWCPHCTKTEKFLKENNIEFKSIDIETSDQSIVDQVIEANGGMDWVVPTLEYNGKWRRGLIFNAEQLKKDLETLGVI